MTGCGKCAGRPIEEALAEAVSCRPDFLPVFALLLQLDEMPQGHGQERRLVEIFSL